MTKPRSAVWWRRIAAWERRQAELGAWIEEREREELWSELGVEHMNVPGSRPWFNDRLWRWVPCFNGDSPQFFIGDVLDGWVVLAGGVYTIRDGEMVVYVGQTRCLVSKRLRGHIAARTAGLTPDHDYRAWTVDQRVTVSEQQQIAKFCPRYNHRLW